MNMSTVRILLSSILLWPFLALSAPPLIYRPPVIPGIPDDMIVASTRQKMRAPLLAPPHVALTSRAQPDLFWHAPGPMTVQVVLEEWTGSGFRILFTGVTACDTAGFQGLRLADTNLSLTPGKVYALTLSPPQSTPTMAFFLHRPMNEELQGQVAAALTREERARLLAGQGYWFDAIEVLDPFSPEPAQRALLDDLLTQVGGDEQETN